MNRECHQTPQRRPNDAPEIVLPTRNKADQLLNIYWEIVYVLYPFVDKSHILQKYHDLFEGRTGDDQDTMFVCLLNVMFALSSQLNGAIKAEDRESSARTYFERAKGLLDSWGVGSFQSVQVHLLLGQYFQSTNDPHQCWMMIGIAIRTAQSLGLHLPETTEAISSPRTRELMRIVWHGCVVMDRVVSMTYGRPPMISATLAKAVPRPVAVDHENLPDEDGGVIPDPGKPAIIEFFIRTLELYDVLYDILMGLYHSSTGREISLDDMWDKYLGRSGIGNQPPTIEIERKLVRWERNLPFHLRLDYGGSQSGHDQYFTRQAVILHQRYVLAPGRNHVTCGTNRSQDIFTSDCFLFVRYCRRTSSQRQVTWRHPRHLAMCCRKGLLCSAPLCVPMWPAKPLIWLTLGGLWILNRWDQRLHGGITCSSSIALPQF